MVLFCELTMCCGICLHNFAVELWIKLSQLVFDFLEICLIFLLVFREPILLDVFVNVPVVLIKAKVILRSVFVSLLVFFSLLYLLFFPEFNDLLHALLGLLCLSLVEI
jgi:hypothetical protein